MAIIHKSDELGVYRTNLRKRHAEEEVLLVIGVAQSGVRTIPDSGRRGRISASFHGATVGSTPERRCSASGREEQPSGRN